MVGVAGVETEGLCTIIVSADMGDGITVVDGLLGLGNVLTDFGEWAAIC